MFIAQSSFTIANDKNEEVRQAFRERPHLVDKEPGFLRMEVISPSERPNEIKVITYWTDEASFTAWHKGDAFHKSHKKIPKGLVVSPGTTNIQFFEHISS